MSETATARDERPGDIDGAPASAPAGRGDAAGASAAGEREFRGRETGPVFRWVKIVSWIELAIFGGLLVVWLGPGMERLTFWFGLAHGVGFLILCTVIWVAVLRREAPFWLLAASLTPVGPVGSTIGVEVIERRERRRGLSAGSE